VWRSAFPFYHTFAVTGILIDDDKITVIDRIGNQSKRGFLIDTVLHSGFQLDCAAGWDGIWIDMPPVMGALFHVRIVWSLPDDGDGLPDAGESIVLNINVKNVGGYADSVWLHFQLGTYEDTTVVDITDSLSAFGNIGLSEICIRFSSSLDPGSAILRMTFLSFS